MSFLSIKDPHRRDQMVNEFLTTKRNIQLNNLSERLGDIEMKREFTKVFAPITESQQKATEVAEKGFAATQKAISEMPKQLALEFPMPEALSKALPTIGSTAANYLKTYLGKTAGDTRYGIHTEGDKFYIGNKEVKIDDNDIVIGDKKYKGTPGLWELITSKNPNNYSQEDATNYANILYSTNTMYVHFDPNKGPSSSRGVKWKNVISDIWKNKPLSLREIPSASTDSQRLSSTDPNELVKKFALLSTSKKAGNAGVNNEMTDIANELYNQKIINDEEYQSMLKKAQN